MSWNRCEMSLGRGWPVSRRSRLPDASTLSRVLPRLRHPCITPVIGAVPGDMPKLVRPGCVRISCGANLSLRAVPSP